MSKFWLVIFAGVMSFCVQAQELVKDINTSAGSQVTSQSSYGQNCYTCGSYIFFFARDYDHGWELWRTDGTQNGTIRLTDLVPGPGDGVLADQVHCYNGNAIYRAGNGIWKTDGVANGGVKIVDTSTAGETVIFGDKIVYPGNTNSVYSAPISGGTPTLIKQFTLATGVSSLGIDFQPIGTKLFMGLRTYNFNTSISGFELWVHDGTTLTQLQSYTVPNFVSTLSLAAVNDLLVFKGFDPTNGAEPWVTDGTVPGTHMLADLASGPTASDVLSIEVIDSRLIISQQQPFATWITDGTPVGTTKIIDGFFTRFARKFNGKIYLSGAQTGGYRLAVASSIAFSDGEYISPPGNISRALAVAGSKVITAMEISPYGNELFGYDPMTDQFAILKKISPASEGSFPRSFAELGSNAYFLADDGIHGLELWKTDGTANGTTLFKDIALQNSSAEIETIYTYNKKLYFPAKTTTTSSKDLWASNGTAAGTEKIYPANAFLSWITGVGKYVVTNVTNYMKTDVETKTTSVLMNPTGVYNGFGTGLPKSNLTIGNTIYEFLSIDPVVGTGSGTELWKINPVTNEMGLIKDINPGLASSNPNGYMLQGAVLGNKIIFSAKSPDGVEPWVSDGTEAGTMLLKNIHPTGDSSPRAFTALNGKVYFYARNPSEGTELWETDGTPAGTKILIDLYPGASDGFGSFSMAALGNQIFFVGRDGTTSPFMDLWSTDGTPQGTKLFKSLSAAGGWSGSDNFTTSGNRVYFYANNFANGYEVWSTDGTPAGTRFVETAVGSAGSFPEKFLPDNNGGLYFLKEGKIWRTFGQQETTRAFGPATPTSNLYLTEDHIVFVQDDPTYGKELFRYAIPAPENQTITFPPLPTKLVTDAPFNANATASSGLPVEYTSSDESVATISATGEITIHSAGSTSIVANQSGNENFNPVSAPVTRVLVVDKVSQTINITAFGTKKIDDDPFQLVASATSGLPLTYSSSDETVATISATGLITIHATGQTIIKLNQAGDATYNSSSKQVTVDIGRTSQTITFDALPIKTFGDGPFQATATASSGLDVTFVSANTSIAQVTPEGEIAIVGAGVTQITALQAGDESYNAAPSVSRDITINKANQTVTFEPLPAVLASDDDFFVDAEASSGLSVTYTSSNDFVATISSDGKTSIEAAGTTIITALQLGNNNYNPAPSVTRNLVVKEKGQTITLVAINDKVATDDPFFVTAFASSGLPVTFASFNTEIATISADGLVTLHGTGIVTIIATQEGDDVWGEAEAKTTSFNVTKASQEITFPPIASIPDGAGPFGLNASASSGLVIIYKTAPSAEATVVVNGNLATTSGVGHATIIATQPGNTKYSAAQDVSITFCVNPKQPTIAVTQNTESATLRSSAATNNSWIRNGDPLGLSTQEITVTQDGIYKVSTTQFNCKSDLSEGANIVITAVEEANEISVYPNPAAKTLVIKSANASMQILDTFGRVHINQKIHTPETHIDVSSLTPGVYFVVIDNTWRQKFVKQ